MDKGAWWATVHGVAKRWTLLSDLAQHTHASAGNTEMNKTQSLMHFIC